MNFKEATDFKWMLAQVKELIARVETIEAQIKKPAKKAAKKETK